MGLPAAATEKLRSAMAYKHQYPVHASASTIQLDVTTLKMKRDWQTGNHCAIMHNASQSHILHKCKNCIVSQDSIRARATGVFVVVSEAKRFELEAIFGKHYACSYKNCDS